MEKIILNVNLDVFAKISLQISRVKMLLTHPFFSILVDLK